MNTTALVSRWPALLALAAGSAAAAPGLDVYSQAAGGQSILGAGGTPFSCATFSPDPRSARFGGGYRVSLPSDGPVCGVATDTDHREAAAGPLFASAGVSAAFGTAGDPRSFTGSAAARAGYGTLGVRAGASYSGTVDPFVVDGSGAGALQTEVFTFSGASGNGRFRPTFTIDGELLTTGRTDNEIVFSYILGGLTYTGFRIQDSRGSLSFYTPGGYVAALPGIVVSGNNTVGQRVTGRTSFQLDIPITFGTPLELGYALWAGVLPSSSVLQPGPSAGEASFYSSLRLTGIELFDSSGQALASFGVSAGSGTVYGAVGVVPEAPAWALMAAGLAGLAWRRRAQVPQKVR